MTEKELLEKNRFTEEEYKKRLVSNGIKCLRIIFPIKKWKKSEKRRKEDADMRKLKRMVQNKKEVDEFVKKLKEQRND